ncbi:hypothetical protein IWQ61_002668 [Dispira simplex]|nr:hypothetical protein IWQ61_002668 [Dispira simplex]
MKFKNLCTSFVLAALAIGSVASPISSIASLTARTDPSFATTGVPDGAILEVILQSVNTTDNEIEGNVQFTYRIDGTGIEISGTLSSSEEDQEYSVRVFNGEVTKGAYCGMASIYDPCGTMESDKPYHCDYENPGEPCIAGDLTGRFGVVFPTDGDIKASEVTFFAYKDVGCDLRPDFSNKVVAFFNRRNDPVACGIVKYLSD